MTPLTLEEMAESSAGGEKECIADSVEGEQECITDTVVVGGGDIVLTEEVLDDNIPDTVEEQPTDISVQQETNAAVTTGEITSGLSVSV